MNFKQQKFLLVILLVNFRVFCQSPVDTVLIPPEWESYTQSLAYRRQLTKIIPRAVSTDDSIKLLYRFYRKNRRNIPAPLKYGMLYKYWQMVTQQKDTVRMILALHEAAGAMAYTERHKFSITLGYRARALSRKIYNDTLEFISNKVIISNMTGVGQNDKVIRFVDSLEKKTSVRQHPAWISIYTNLGTALDNKNMPDEAIKYYLKAYDMSKSFTNYRGQVFTLYNVGFTFIRLQQYEKGIDYMKRALKLARKYHIEDYEAYCMDQLGLAYGQIDSVSLAVNNYLRAKEYFKRTGNKFFEALVAKNIAAIYINADSAQKALPYSLEAVQLSENLPQTNMKLGALGTLMVNYIALDRYDKAEKILKSQVRVIDQLDIPTRIDLYEGLYQLAMYKGDYRKAFKYYRVQDSILDSLMLSQKKEAITEIESKYRIEKKEKENQMLKAKQAEQALLLARQREKNIYLTGGVLLSVTLAGIFAFFYRRNRRQRMMIESLQRELHHRIKNNLALLNVLTDQIAREFDDARLRERLSDLKSRINSIHEIHSQLYRKQDVNKVNMKQYLEKLVNNVKETFKKENISVEIQVAENMDWSPEKTFPLGLFVVEFLINSFKYAFPDNKGGKIQIRLIKEGGRQVVLLKDDGVGIENEDLLKDKKTFGLNLLRALAKQMGGRMEIIKEKGFGVKLVF